MVNQNKKSMTTKEEKKVIESLTNLAADLLALASDYPQKARKYNNARGFVERALRSIGAGIVREFKRPESVGLPVHETMEREPERPEPVGDILASNIKDEPKTRRK